MDTIQFLRDKLTPRWRNVTQSIVARALSETITDIGQLTNDELRALRNAVKSGVLDKGKAGGYPAIKTVYASKGYNFTAARKRAEAMLDYWHSIDVARGVVTK